MWISTGFMAAWKPTEQKPADKADLFGGFITDNAPNRKRLGWKARRKYGVFYAWLQCGLPHRDERIEKPHNNVRLSRPRRVTNVLHESASR
jgi:hypothetical protein